MIVIKILNSNCWVAEHEQGDPPRTLKLVNAQQFDSVEEANTRIEEIRKTHPLRTFSYEIQTPVEFKDTEGNNYFYFPQDHDKFIKHKKELGMILDPEPLDPNKLIKHLKYLKK